MKWNRPKEHQQVVDKMEKFMKSRDQSIKTMQKIDREAIGLLPEFDPVLHRWTSLKQKLLNDKTEAFGSSWHGQGC